VSKVPPCPKPWRIVEAEGHRWMVRGHDGCVWLVRLPDRTVWLLDRENAPSWAGGGGKLEAREQIDLF
jgi:hypothetical protein